MKKKQTILQKLKTWWHNLPHKWFLVFQILLASIYTWLISITGDNFPIVLLMGAFIGTIIQIFFIVYYYTWSALLLGSGCFLLVVCLFPMLFLIESYQSVWIMMIFLAFSSPIIPQLWRLKNHGRK